MRDAFGIGFLIGHVTPKGYTHVYGKLLYSNLPQFSSFMSRFLNFFFVFNFCNFLNFSSVFNFLNFTNFFSFASFSILASATQPSALGLRLIAPGDFRCSSSHTIP